MTRLRVTLTTGAALFAALATNAGAAPMVLAPAGSKAPAWSLALGVDAGGRALLSWTATHTRPQQTLLTELTQNGLVGAPIELLAEHRLSGPAFLAPSAAGDTVVAAAYTPAYSSLPLLALRRQPGAASFAAATTINDAGFGGDIVSADHDGAGSMAVVTRDRSRNAVLLTAAPDGRWHGPRPLGDGSRRGPAAVAVGPGGRVVVAYTTTHGLAVQRGRVGRTLGSERIVAGRRSTYPAVAIDDRGTTTIAFVRAVPQARQPYLRRYSMLVVRALAGRGFSAPAMLDDDPADWPPTIASARSTTAVGWTRGYRKGGLRVAVARGRGPFALTQEPAAPRQPLRGYEGRYPSSPAGARLAVDADGDVLLAYSYGQQSTHATLWRAGTPGFPPPRVLSTLGHGGDPVVALLPDRSPLIAFGDDDAVYLGDLASGTPLDLSPPRITMAPLDPSELRRTGVLTTRVRCSEPCTVWARGRLTTGKGRSGGTRQVITRRYFRPQIVPAGRALVLRFEVKPASRPALDAGHYAKAIIGVTATNASGAARSLRQVVQFACNRPQPDCPPAPAI